MAKRDKELPAQAVVGDRIRLKAERIRDYEQACKAAMHSFDPYAIRTVTRTDHYAPGGGDRLFVEGAPHCFKRADVSIAWNSEDERKEMLRVRGWTYVAEEGRWVEP